MDLDRWYVYLILYNGAPIYVGKGTDERLFVSAYNSWVKLLDLGHKVEPHMVSPHFLFSDIELESVAYGLETYVIYSFDENHIPILNIQRREITRVERVKAQDFVRVEGDVIIYHPPPCRLPTRLYAEMHLQQYGQPTNLHINGAWLYKLGRLTSGVSVIID